MAHHFSFQMISKFFLQLNLGTENVMDYCTFGVIANFNMFFKVDGRGSWVKKETGQKGRVKMVKGPKGNGSKRSSELFDL